MLNKIITRNNTQYAFLVLFISVFIANLMAYAPVKIIAAFILLIGLFIIFIPTHPFPKIYLTLVMITFPITLTILGKDAVSTGTLIILIIFTWSLTRYKIKYTIAKDKFLFGLLFLLIGIAFAGMVTQTPQSYWGPAARKYLDLVSSIALFILIINSQNIKGIADSKRHYIEKIITALLIITVLHVFLSFIIFISPSIEAYFAIFFTRTQENLGNLINGAYERGATIFTNGEEFGELLVLVFPFALYKFFSTNRIIYIFITGSLLAGVLLTGTRSALFLIAFELLMFLIFALRRINIQKIIIPLAVVVISAVIFLLVSPLQSTILERLKATFLNIATSADFVTVMNRQLVWPQAFALTKNTLSFFGHGPSQAYVIGFSASNFHELYLTMLFQFGIVGTIVFLSFFVKLFGALLKQLNIVGERLRQRISPDYLLIMACLISLSCFLINEVKFEFNRGDSYQQLVWAVFSIYYLTGHILEKNEIE